MRQLRPLDEQVPLVPARSADDGGKGGAHPRKRDGTRDASAEVAEAMRQRDRLGRCSARRRPPLHWREANEEALRRAAEKSSPALSTLSAPAYSATVRPPELFKIATSERFAGWTSAEVAPSCIFSGFFSASCSFFLNYAACSRFSFRLAGFERLQIRDVNDAILQRGGLDR